MLKASAGAAEFIPMLETSATVRFLRGSIDNGWKVYAAAPPKQGTSSVNVSELQDPLQEGPCIVVVGNEGRGLREEVLRAAQFRVGVPAMAAKNRIVDSINVAAATAILCERFIAGTVAAKENLRAEAKDSLW